MIMCLAISAATSTARDATPKSPPAKGGNKAKAKTKAAAEALAGYQKALECYKSGTLTDLKDKIGKIGRKKFLLPRTAQRDIAYMMKSLPAYRPVWWKNTRSSSNVSFKATLWGRRLTANYEPSEMPGMQTPVGVKNGKLVVVVSWRPNMIDNPQPASGYLARRHKLAKGAVGEAAAWHELGHNYISYFLPLEHVMVLFENHEQLFHHLQEFYADMTSLYHSSPGGRLALLFTRLESMVRYDEAEPHDRAAHAIGALILSNVLMRPEKWPSFNFPPKVPKKDIELLTILYLYEYIDPKWTIAEDRALREITRKFIAAHGAKVLRTKGTVNLPSRIPLKLMVSDDRSHQKKRDAWVKTKLEALIRSGRAKRPDRISRRPFEMRIEQF